jgi:hypothetical protein
MSNRRRVLYATVAVAAAAMFAATFLTWGHTHVGAAAPEAAHADAQAAGVALPALPASPHPAFAPHKPVLLDDPHDAARWAPVLRTVVAHSDPTDDSAPVTTLSTTTPENTTNIVLVLRDEVSAGTVWALVRLPVLPNGTVGWVPRSALGGYEFVQTHLVIDRQRLLATLYRDDRVVFEAPIGIGTPQSPTPAGEFFIRDKLTKFRSPFYGPVAFGTSARSAVLTDWPGGGFVGVHGTNEPQLIPGRVSHGCIRLRNADILRLAHLLPVGTPVTIR